MIEVKRKPDAAPVINVEFDVPDESTYAKNSVNEIGYKPIFSFYGLPIQPKDIHFCNISSRGFIPELTLYFSDPVKLMQNEAFPLDNAIISMLIRSGDDKLRPARIDFKITGFKYLQGEDLYFVSGIMNVDNLFISPFQSYSQMSSFDVMDKMSKDSKLGFASNIPSTNDVMTWINPGLANISFIQDTISKAYKDDNSFMWGFIDFYYTLNFIDVEKQLRDYDPNPAIVTYDRTGNTEEKTKATLDNIILTNDPVLVKSAYDFSFTDFRVYNDSTQISIDEGYKQQVYFYDRSGNWANKAGMFMKHDLNSLLRPNAEKESIIMKDLPSVTNGFYKSNVKQIYAGILDVDNTHNNYNYAKFQNKYNLEEIQKVYMEIDMTQPNFNIIKFQNIDIGIVEENTGVKDDNVNRRLTGRWLVTAIDFNYDGTTDEFKQTITLIKRELGA